MPRDTLSARIEREREQHTLALDAVEKTLSETERALSEARLENARLTAIMAVLKAALEQAEGGG